MNREVLFRRNSTPYEDREKAIAAIPNIVNEYGVDGSELHVRYMLGTVIKTILVSVAAGGCYSYYEESGNLFSDYDDKTKFPEKGEPNIIYIDNSTHKSYRWGGNEYISICGDGKRLEEDDIRVICS